MRNSSTPPTAAADGGTGGEGAEELFEVDPAHAERRFPLRVELQSLGKDEFVRILTEPENALTKQYTALMETEGIELHFDDDAIEEMARIAVEVNDRTEEIGARRLHTVIERVLDVLSFDASERGEQRFEVTAQYVRDQVQDIVEDQDLSRFIL